LKLAPYLFVRPGELRMMEHSELNLDAAEWRIPGARMKMGEPHIVPLSSQAVAILRNVQLLGVNGRYVLPSLLSRDRPMSENTYNRAQRLDERRKMMQAWSDYLDRLRADARRADRARWRIDSRRARAMRSEGN
jgi:integrase